MNLYFLVKGKRTERKVYPMWLSILKPAMVKISYAADANDNNYYLMSGEGYPSLLNHLENVIAEINEIGEESFLNELISRHNETGHTSSFQEFINFIRRH